MTAAALLPSGHPHRGALAAVATRHRKTPLLARALGGPGGLRLRTVPVDTDAFGTFTGDVTRTGTAVETAVAKARCGVRVAGHPVGLASEGSFAPHPVVGFVTHQVEQVVLVDVRTDLVVVGRAEAPAPWAGSWVAEDPEDVRALGELLAGSGQRLVVRPDDPVAAGRGIGVTKGIERADDLGGAVELAVAASGTGRARVETDLRAHVCPRRHPVLLGAARDLAVRLRTRCVSCGSPGFGRNGTVPGAPCAWCARPTAEPLARVDSCPACELRVETAVGRPADPGRCSHCNP
ncbi:DUF6671 family protein [Nocardioides sp.]|uniref:DUF6671 family protein n=1 Tax=Nocardioides sp. TaxID=35761 RepID=UPI0037837A8C